ncbi:hypothetical protein M3C58_00130 [Brachybacterium muris]|nr:hypothetical protein [Brachybacterium muris]MCT1655174.1 hypothetical protein [Brachybacterium muris]MCT1996628.1 hypothetical protein [Brachybacterium muris]MCT2177829.1 hypothetical protein [Brachybacterium muris]
MSERSTPPRAHRSLPAAPRTVRAAPRTLPAASRAWRILLVLAAIGVLLAGQFLRSNDLFPLGSLDQYSRGTDPDGHVINTCLQGVRDDGEPFDIPFGNHSVGIQRADVENHLRTIREDPERLAPLAAEYDRRHADEPALTAVVLCQRITHLKDGAPHGDPEFVEVVRWEADA